MHARMTRAFAAVTGAALAGAFGVAGISGSGAAVAAPRATRSSAAPLRAAAAPGAQLWAERYNGPGNAGDSARSVAVNRSGTTVFVTGQSAAHRSLTDYATITYNAATGQQLWLRRYNGP